MYSGCVYGRTSLTRGCSLACAALRPYVEGAQLCTGSATVVLSPVYGAEVQQKLPTWLLCAYGSPCIHECANEAVPRQGKGGLINACMYESCARDCWHQLTCETRITPGIVRGAAVVFPSVCVFCMYFVCLFVSLFVCLFVCVCFALFCLWPAPHPIFESQDARSRQ